MMNAENGIINFSLMQCDLVHGISGHRGGIALLHRNWFVTASDCESTLVANILGLRSDLQYLDPLFAELEVPVSDFHAILIADLFGQIESAKTIPQVETFKKWQLGPIDERLENGLIQISRKLKARFPEHLRLMLNQHQATRGWGGAKLPFWRELPVDALHLSRWRFSPVGFRRIQQSK